MAFPADIYVGRCEVTLYADGSMSAACTSQELELALDQAPQTGLGDVVLWLMMRELRRQEVAENNLSNGLENGGR